MQEIVYDKKTKKRKRRKYLLLLVLCGFLTGATLTFTELGFLEWVTLIPSGYALIKLAEDRKIKLYKFYFYGLAFFWSFYIAIYHWFLWMYPMEFLGISPDAALYVVVFCWLGLSLFQALQGGLVILIFAAIIRYTVAGKHKIIIPFAAGGLWAIFEWVQTFGWFGVPWGRLALGQIEYLENLQTASLFGSYFITFLIVSVNFLLSLVFLAEDSLRVKKSICVTSAASIILLNYFVGMIIMSTYEPEKNRVIKAASIQANISTDEKWSDDVIRISLDRYSEYSRAAASEGAKIIVWSETAMTYCIESRYFPRDEISELAKECDATILVGGFTEEGIVDEGIYNIIIAFTPDGEVYEKYYAKQKLVPFGEFVPMRPFIETCLPFLADMVLSFEEAVAGDSTLVYDLEVGKISPIICFDSIYEQVTLDSVREGAEVITVSSNDGWFKDSAGIYMHFSQSQLRAIETGRCIVRSANTGISGVINSCGEILDMRDPLTEGYACGEIELRDDLTLYSQIGNSFVYLCIAGIFSLLVIKIISLAKDRTISKNT